MDLNSRGLLEFVLCLLVIQKKIISMYLSIYLSIYIYDHIYIYSMYDYIYMYMCVLTVCVHLDTTTKKSNSHVSKNGGCQTHFAA